ncbi:flagellar protein FlgN [Paenibacillus illinoisensis]|uniref:Flagellar protein n=1 Tax=Paenibacillus illinoisensis TaxID=59845 RepID=A0A2W0CBM4_9BACL|nr:flagellar protein FlgN [Paenibacillus illinoisensis]PYY29567.1 Flagellar protein [Paenibacillus illinoisensis]
MSLLQVTHALKQLIELHEQLIAVGEEKKQAIMSNDISVVTHCVAKEAQLVKKVNVADEGRVNGVYGFLREKGIRSQLNLTITEMTRLVFDPTERNELIVLQTSLHEQLSRLKELNAINKDLIEQSLTFIDYSMNLIVNQPEDHMIYQNPSKQKLDAPNRNYFDTRA